MRASRHSLEVVASVENTSAPTPFPSIVETNVENQQPPEKFNFWKWLVDYIKQKDFIRLVISIVYIVIVVLLTGIFLMIKAYRRPNQPPLPDVVFAVIPWVNGSLVSHILLGVVSVFVIIWFSFDPRRLAFFRQMIVIWATMMLLRDFVFVCTSLPNSNPQCPYQEPSRPLKIKWHEYVRSLAGIKGDTCNDFVKSGHCIGLLLPTIMFCYYFKTWWIQLILWVLSLVGLIFLVLCRYHYTSYVIMESIVISSFTWIYLTISNNEAIYKTSTPIFRWYYKLMEWDFVGDDLPIEVMQRRSEDMSQSPRRSEDAGQPPSQL